MARSDLVQLYKALMRSGLSFVGEGEFTIYEIYARVQATYQELCDDSYLCSTNCGGIHHQPEWRHVTRKALTDLKRRGQGVASGHERRLWMMGLEPTVPVLEEYMEGQALLTLHKRRERSRRAVRRKKEVVLAATGRLVCEACGLDPELVYGQTGRNLCECHHRIPLGDLAEHRITRLDDLAIVCPNCHRILHRSRNSLTVEQLHSLILARRRHHVA